ncbi:hypothetical protein, partial [Escherichia coli]|uniref:hypothetical protein n=1 Tax=Escherichia coli TaxID=562 RepID=UPI001379D5F5
TGVRVDFDPFNASDVQTGTYDGQAYIGGSLSSDFLKPGASAPYSLSEWFNVTVPTKFNGYVRPIDVTARQYIVVDTTNVAERTLTSDQNTTIGDLFIIGTGDFTLAKDVEIDMGPNFLVDFSALNGEVNNFTLANFQEVGQVRGNSLEG